MLSCYTGTAWHRASAPSSHGERQLAGRTPRMSGMRSRAAVVPAPLPTLPSLREHRIFPVQGSPSPAPSGKTTGQVGTPSEGAGAGVGRHGWSAWVQHVLRTYCVPSASRVFTQSHKHGRFCLTDQKLEAQRGIPWHPQCPHRRWGGVLQRGGPFRSAAGHSGCRQRGDVGGLSPGSGGWKLSSRPSPCSYGSGHQAVPEFDQSSSGPL